MKSEMNTPFSVGGKGHPLWRLRMVRTPKSTDLILPISHSIVDALGNYALILILASLTFLVMFPGMTVFFDDLLQYYSQIERQQKDGDTAGNK